MNLQEFGQTIKAKYPEYKDIPDEELGTKMLAKYPEYENMVSKNASRPKSSWKELPANFLPSAGKFVGDIYQSVSHPIDTAKGLGNIALGAAEKLIPGEQGKEQYADAVGQFFKNRYGGLDKLKETIITDPVGFASDLGTVLSGGGAIASKIGTASGLGKLATAGKAISQVGNAIEPLSSATRAVGTAIDTATAGKKLAPFAKRVDTSALEAAARQGVELPASSLSKSNVVKMLETIGGRGLFGDKLNVKLEKAISKMDDIANTTVDAIKADENLSSIGDNIVKSLEKYKENYIAAKNQLFSEAKIPLITNMDVSKSISFLDEIINTEKGASKVLGKPTAELIFYKKLKEGLSNKPTARQLDATINKLNQKANNFMDPISTGDKASLKKVIATMDDDFVSSLERVNPDVAAKIKTANTFYKEGLKKLDTEYAKKIFKFKEQPDKILPALINKSTSIDDIPRIIETIGPENAKSLQAFVLTDIFDTARSKATGEFTASGITGGKAKYGNKLNAILSPEQIKVVNDLEELSKAISRGQSTARGSQTAFTIRAMTELSALFNGSIALAAQMFLGDAAFSKLITNAPGQNLLTTGIQMTGKTGKAIKKAADRINKPSQALFQSGRIVTETIE